MLNISNILSVLRAPLAFTFLSVNPILRCVAIILAMMTDFLDGYFARRFRNTSQLGAVLDPLMDKFFVVFLLAVFYGEGRVASFEIAAFLCRDFAVIIFGIYLQITGEYARYQFRSIWCGKVATTLQFFVLIALTLDYAVPFWIYVIFVVLGFFALIELYIMAQEDRKQRED